MKLIIRSICIFWNVPHTHTQKTQTCEWHLENLNINLFSWIYSKISLSHVTLVDFELNSSTSGPKEKRKVAIRIKCFERKHMEGFKNCISNQITLSKRLSHTSWLLLNCWLLKERKRKTVFFRTNVFAWIQSKVTFHWFCFCSFLFELFSYSVVRYIVQWCAF